MKAHNEKLATLLLEEDPDARLKADAHMKLPAINALPDSGRKSWCYAYQYSDIDATRLYAHFRCVIQVQYLGT